MHNKAVVILLEADKTQDVFTNLSCPHVGIFHLYGGSARQENLVHSILIPGIADTGHILKITVGDGPTGRFTVENVSDPIRKLEFQYKHSGRSKKHLKPGEIIAAPEIHLLLWDSWDAENKPIVVSLTLIPLTHAHGLRLLYTSELK